MSQILPSLLSETQEHVQSQEKPLPSESSEIITSKPSSVDQEEIIQRDKESENPEQESEEKKFSCPHCDHKFTRKHNLKSHLLIHTKEKPFSCSICSSKFRRLHDLKRHEKLHTGEKPYQCKNCGRKFARCDALVRHNNSQSGCTLLVDDAILKHRLDDDFPSPQQQNQIPNQQNDYQPPLKKIAYEATWKLQQPQPQAQPHIHSQIQKPQTQHQDLHQSFPQQQLPQQAQQAQTRQISSPQIPQQQIPHQIQSSLERSNSITSQQFISHSLPSINRLTPLISERSNGNNNIEINESNYKNYDLLPYVKLLESRVSTLETKLSTTETKLAQLTYQLQNNE